MTAKTAATSDKPAPTKTEGILKLAARPQGVTAQQILDAGLAPNITTARSRLYGLKKGGRLDNQASGTYTATNA